MESKKEEQEELEGARNMSAEFLGEHLLLQGLLAYKKPPLRRTLQ